MELVQYIVQEREKDVCEIVQRSMLDLPKCDIYCHVGLGFHPPAVVGSCAGFHPPLLGC